MMGKQKQEASSVAVRKEPLSTAVDNYTRHRAFHGSILTALKFAEETFRGLKRAYSRQLSGQDREILNAYHEKAEKSHFDLYYRDQAILDSNQKISNLQYGALITAAITIIATVATKSIEVAGIGALVIGAIYGAAINTARKARKYIAEMPSKLEEAQKLLKEISANFRGILPEDINRLLDSAITYGVKMVVDFVKSEEGGQIKALEPAEGAISGNGSDPKINVPLTQESMTKGNGRGDADLARPRTEEVAGLTDAQEKLL
jgi:hypothetical protein